VFDLDGTLIDGFAAVHEALAYAVSRLGKTPPSLAETRSMVGYGLNKLVERAAGRGCVPEGVRLFREYYPRVAAARSRLLPGARETLAAIAEVGVAMAVASNKPPDFSRMILEAKGVAGRFRSIVGPDDRFPPKPDPTMLRALMEETDSRPEETICVGDMEVDVEFARAAGCRIAAVPTGARSREFLESAIPDVLLDSLAELPGALSDEMSAER
jgi:phosphoglycolate phosphatase